MKYTLPEPVIEFWLKGAQCIYYDDSQMQAAFEAGRLEGIKQEHALQMISDFGQDIEYKDKLRYVLEALEQCCSAYLGHQGKIDLAIETLKEMIE